MVVSTASLDALFGSVVTNVVFTAELLLRLSASLCGRYAVW